MLWRLSIPSLRRPRRSRKKSSHGTEAVVVRPQARPDAIGAAARQRGRGVRGCTHGSTQPPLSACGGTARRVQLGKTAALCSSECRAHGQGLRGSGCKAILPGPHGAGGWVGGRGGPLTHLPWSRGASRAARGEGERGRRRLGGGGGGLGESSPPRPRRRRPNSSWSLMPVPAARVDELCSLPPLASPSSRCPSHAVGVRERS
jgi:hypothetical protein